MPWVGAEPEEECVLSPAQPQRDIPVSDDACYRAYPRWSWVYDRLQLSQVQELRCGPCGVDPDQWPVITKPIINLVGLSQGVQLHPRATSLDHLPGYFWSEVLPAPQYSVDMVFERGVLRWHCATRCLEQQPGIFRGFQVGVNMHRSLRECVIGFVDCYLGKYTGIVNAELRDGAIVELHLRPSLQYMEFYGPGFVSSLAELYDKGKWHEPGAPRPGWSVPVYDSWRVDRLPPDLELRACYTGESPWHPPGFHRTGYVNSTSKDVALLAARSLGSCLM